MQCGLGVRLRHQCSTRVLHIASADCDDVFHLGQDMISSAHGNVMHTPFHGHATAPEFAFDTFCDLSEKGKE